MSEPLDFISAKFIPQTGSQKGLEIAVQFNPASLQYTVTNTLKEEGSGNQKKQYVSQSTGKLTMDLVFDTTHDGQDVRIHTEKIAKFMEPTKESGNGKKEVLAIVQFEWGLYKFTGMVESYKETIDFFASNGVPLRATINLTMVRQDKVFESSPHSNFDTQGSLSDVVEKPTSPEEDMTKIGASGGDPRAGRSIAAANSQESMRFPSGTITLSADIKLGSPVAFATGSAGGGLEINSGANFSIGGNSSAGVSASSGAFAGLRTSTQSQRFNTKIDTSRFIQRSESVNYATGRNASFQVGGQAVMEDSASLRADVGISASLSSRMQFEG